MAFAQPPRQFTMVPGQDIDPLFLCPICQDSWADPVELVPCGDIFCLSCISAARAQHAAQPMIMENFQCPQCHTVVQSEKKPNRMLLNTVLEVEVECQYCKWRGTREMSSQHECEEGERQKKAAQAAAAVSAPPSQQQQQRPAFTSLAGDGASTSPFLQSSTAPAPSEADVPQRASGSSQQPVEAVMSSSPALRGPRRAVQEIEGAFTAIEDDPTSTTLRTRTASAATAAASGGGGGGGGDGSASPATSYGYGFGVGWGSMYGGAVNGVSSARARDQDQVLSSPMASVVGGAPASPPSPSPSGAVAPPMSSISSPPTPSSAIHAAEPWRRYRLSQVDYDQMVGIYMMYDEGTGRLTFQQLRDLCFCMNFVQREEDAHIIFRSMDVAQKGYVTQDDFLLWLSTHRPDPSALFGLTQFEYTDAILQFRSADPEYNGVIDANEFCALCLTNGYASSLDEAMRYFHLCDDHHTGYISLQQYLQHLKAIKSSKKGLPSQFGTNQYPLPPQQQQPLGHVFSAASPSGAHANTGDNSGGSSTPPSARQVSPGYRQPYQALQQQFGTPDLYLSNGAATTAPQQQYSQMGRSTMPVNPQTPSPLPGLAQQGRTESPQSRLYRSSTNAQRDEECTMM